MYTNVNGKIKTLAKVIAWLGIISSVIAGIAIIVTGASLGSYYGMGGGSTVFAGLLTIVIGAVCSWAGSLVLYAFGELCDNVAAARSKLEK